MVMYTTAADVALYLNRVLTSEQIDQAEDYIAAASAWIDQQTARHWAPSSPTTELHTVNQPWIYTYTKPILAVTSITIRDPSPGSQPITLTEDVGYELLDASRGLISLEIGLNIGVGYGTTPHMGWHSPYYGYIATVTYTHAQATPDNIKLAATILAAHTMNMSLNPMSQRIRSYSDNRAVSVSFKDSDSVVKEAKMLLPPKQVFLV